MKCLALFTLSLVLVLSGCGTPAADPDTAQESIQIIAMDTAMLITTYGEQSVSAAYAAEGVIRDLDGRLSRANEDSEVFRLNLAAGEAAEVGEDLYFLLGRASRLSAETEGAFDVTIAPVASAWGFTEDQFRVPSQEELDALLELVDYSKVFCPPVPITSGHLTAALGPGQSIDLGAVAKGYAADRLIKVLQEYDIPRANISLGGNVLAWGSRPDGTPWRVGIQNPTRPDDQAAFAGILKLTDAFAVTSGGYQRYFEQDGKRYHHILDPATGYPADNGLASVTVVASAGPLDQWNGTMCDAYSTALFVMGEERALDFWRGHSENNFDLVLITEDGRVIITEGLANRFIQIEDSGYTYETAS